MAKSLEELILLHRSALRYLFARESNLLALGKRPVNNKIANFIKTHKENDVWTTFLDTLNEDLTRNINVVQLRSRERDHPPIKTSEYILCRASKNIMLKYSRNMIFSGGRMLEAPVVRVEQGELQGRVANAPSGRGYYSFQGIPYAKPPLGSLRFKAPQPPEPWEGVRDATSEGNVSAQIDPVDKTYLGDENCLFLNVYTPNLDGEFLPVMVFIHGGGFRFGSGSSSLYGGDYLVEKDVVVVTLNYRCGALGFLSLNTPDVPGNAGLKDIVQALRWVESNISSFGGNSGNITLFGCSAGGVAASLLAASPLTKSLVSKVIVQSGVALNSWSFQKNPIANARRLASELGCESTDVDEILEFLITTPTRDIVEAYERFNPSEQFVNEGVITFGVVVEKEFPGIESVINEPFISVLNSGRFANVPIMVGSNALEFTKERNVEDLQTYIPIELNVKRNSAEALAIAEDIKRLYFKDKAPVAVESLTERYELLSDVLVNVDTHRFVRYLVKTTNKPIYYYRFDYVGELNASKSLLEGLGLARAAHGDELGYLFRSDSQKKVEPTPQDVNMRETMLRLWTNFAKTGNPSPEENSYITATWLPVTKDNLYCLNIGTSLSLISNPEKEKMEFWDDLYTKYFKIWEQKHEEKQTTNGVQEITRIEEVHITDDAPIIVQETVIKTDGETYVQTVTTTSTTTYEEYGTVVENFGTDVQIQQDIQEIVEDNNVADEQQTEEDSKVKVEEESEINVKEESKVNVEETNAARNTVNTAPEIVDVKEVEKKPQNGVKDSHVNGNVERKPRPSNEIKMVQNNGSVQPKDVIRANDPPEDDLPKNIGVNKFVNFFESLGGKK